MWSLSCNNRLFMYLASVTQTAAANWQRDCKFVPYENDMDPEVPSFFKASPNGEFIALGFGTENSYSLKVWHSMGLVDIAAFTLPGVPLDLQFSDSGDELYVLFDNSLKVMSLARRPFR